MAIEDYASAEEAYEAAAKGLVKKSSEGDLQVEYYSLEELRKAKAQEAADVAAGKKGFGLRFNRLKPPSTG